MISPSLFWTRRWCFPGVFHLLVCHRPVPTPTNTPTKKPLFWDGERLVKKDPSKIIYWLRCNMLFSSCSMLDINTPSPNLLQAKVDLVANSECRSDSFFGRFVSDTSLCVSSTDVFTCAVRIPSSSYSFHFSR
jgi:hypothetical protein